MDLSIIIPCYNEEKNIELLFKECIKTFQKEKINIEYVFINDGSKDNTYQEIKKLLDEQQKSNIVFVDFSRNFGKEAAIYAGLNNSSGNYLAIVDADLQQHPKYILEMYNYIINHKEYDIISCYQSNRKENKIVAFLKKCFYKSFKRITNIDLFENASDFRLFSSNVAKNIINIKEHNRFSKGIFSWIGYKTYYIPYEVNERQYGKSSFSLKSLFKLAFDGLFGFSNEILLLPIKFGIFLVLVLFVLTIVFILKKVLIKYLIYLIILLILSIQNIFIGILGIYLGRCYTEDKNRPIYIAHEIIKSRSKNEKN